MHGRYLPTKVTKNSKKVLLSNQPDKAYAQRASRALRTSRATGAGRIAVGDTSYRYRYR